jgi:hypothetical protein
MHCGFTSWLWICNFTEIYLYTTQNSLPFFQVMAIYIKW